MVQNRRILEIAADAALVLLGTLVYAAGLYFFIEPCQMAPGGASGIALIISHLTDLPVGMLTAAINIPLFLIGYRYIGRDFMWKTLLSVGSFTIFYDYVLALFPVYRGEPLLSCLFGGVLWGLGIGLVFMRAGSTGGTDIINKMIHQKNPHIQLGKVTFASDVVIIIASIFAFGSLESGLYAIITIFVCTQIMDALIYGGDRGKLVYIFSSKNSEISARIQQELDRGTTFLQAEGGYTGARQQVLMCAVRRNEYYLVKRMVHELDPGAFMIAADSAEVMGEGFLPLDHQK